MDNAIQMCQHFQKCSGFYFYFMIFLIVKDSLTTYEKPRYFLVALYTCLSMTLTLFFE